LLVGSYFITAVGIPLPAATRPSSAEPYPCANSQCGCASADQCWRSCCCHTLKQRLAWARQNAERPPAFAIAEAKREGFDLRWLAGPREATAAHSSCCAERTDGKANTCCQSAGTSKEVSASTNCCSKRIEKPEAQTQQDQSQKIVVWQAMTCQGQSLNWLAAVPSLVVVGPDIISPPTLFARLGSPSSDSALIVFADPAVPPPECAYPQLEHRTESLEGFSAKMPSRKR
jgi:hypothetical protein